MTHTFYTVSVNLPGHDSDTPPPPIFKDYGEAAEYLADELDIRASRHDLGDKDGDRFETMAQECRESSETDRFSTDGPDGYRYGVEETEARGRWTAGREHPDGSLVLTFTESPTGLGTTAKEAADEVCSVMGNMVEQPRGDNFAYVLIDSDGLSEAAEELREAGFELADSEGELVG
jgi:hypothetical protein